jgi:ElaB/YqjD/DUF883 family membrane-anchored ribosome-binding protein
MNHILVFIVLLILITISIIYYYSFNNNIKNHIKENFQDLSKFEYVNSILTTNNEIRCVLYDPLRNCGYYAGLTGRITKINFDTFRESSSIILNKVSNIESGFIDKKSQYAYFITKTQPSIIIRIDLSDFKTEKIMYAVLPPTYDNISLTIPSLSLNTTYAYLISTSSFSNDIKFILKVDLSAFTYVTNLNNVIYYTVKYNNPQTSILPYYSPSNNQHIKVGLLFPDFVLKTNNYTKVIPSSLTMDKFEENLYIGTDKGILKYDITNPNAFVQMPLEDKIIRLGPTPIFEKNNPNKLYTTEEITSCIIDNTNQYGFFVTNTSKLLKISLNAFIDMNKSFKIENNSLVSFVNNFSNIKATKNMLIDYNNKYLYGDSNNGLIFKVDIDSNVINILDLSSRKSNMNGGLIIDKENSFLYSTNIDNDNYIFRIKIKDYISAPTEDVQTNDSEIIITPSPTNESRSNISIDEISQIQNSLNSVLNENGETLKSDLDKINTNIDSALKQQSDDHMQIINSINLTLNELNKTKNVIDIERAKINLPSDEPYLLKNITPKTTQTTPNQEQFANLIQNRVHPKINDFINIQPDWRIEWNKNMHNANINPLLVLP